MPAARGPESVSAADTGDPDGGLIEDHDWPVSEEDPGYARSLALAARAGGAPLAQDGFQTVREAGRPGAKTELTEHGG
jgi:hypothetical protein